MTEPLRLGRVRPADAGLPRRGMGRARARPPRALGEAGARRLPGRPRLDHHAAQARRLPRRLRRLRSRRRSPASARADIARLLADAGIIRSRAKIDAAIGSARIYCDMRDARRGLRRLLLGLHRRQAAARRRRHASRPRPPSPRRSPRTLKRRGFKFVGPMIVYAWMQAVGIVNDHAATCFRRGAAA